MSRHSFKDAALALLLAVSLTPSVAWAGALSDQLVGAWSLTSNTESYEDGSSYKWEPDAKGQLIFLANGQFSLQIGVGDRKPVEGNPAMNPVGRYVAYFGTFVASDADKTITFKIERATFPAWDGKEQVRVISDISADGMTYKAAKPLPSAKGPFTPTLVWVRQK